MGFDDRAGVWTGPWRPIDLMAGNSFIVVGLGEVLWDVFPDGKRLGGAPANVAFHAAQLGAAGVVASRVGRDTLGDELVERLAALGLVVDHVQRDDAHVTGTVMVDASRPDDPHYVIHEDVAWDHLEFSDDWLRLAGQADAVCFGTVAQRTAAGRETIQRFLGAATKALVAYDVNLRQCPYTKETLERSLRAAAVVKLNAGEVETLAAMLAPGTSGESFARMMLDRYDLKWVCVTRGADGCSVYLDGQPVTIPGVPVNVVDAVGAGDAFTAGLITGRLRGWQPQRCAMLANELGAMVAGRSGATPDLGGENRRLVERHEKQQKVDEHVIKRS